MSTRLEKLEAKVKKLEEQVDTLAQALLFLDHGKQGDGMRYRLYKAVEACQSAEKGPVNV